MSKRSASPFGSRLRSARLKAGLPQDRLGVMIGLDEGCASARISRYESGVHEPAFEVAEKLAVSLGVPVLYFYCRDDVIAELLLAIADFSHTELSTLAEQVKGITEGRNKPKPD